jgi:hypothetical protein
MTKMTTTWLHLLWLYHWINTAILAEGSPLRFANSVPGVTQSTQPLFLHKNATCCNPQGSSSGKSVWQVGGGHLNSPLPWQIPSLQLFVTMTLLHYNYQSAALIKEHLQFFSRSIFFVVLIQLIALRYFWRCWVTNCSKATTTIKFCLL